MSEENLSGYAEVAFSPDGRGAAEIRLLVVDDHEVVRKGLAMVLSLEPDIRICCEAGSGAEAIEKARELRPDVILMDFKMPGMNGIEAARAIKASLPQCKILILTGVDADSTIFEALESGIDGYILKEVTPDELVRAVHSVAAGQAYLHPTVTRKVLARMNQARGTGPQPKAPYVARQPISSSGNEESGYYKEPSEKLTERELEVLRGVALGQNNREIAQSLIVGEETIRSHLKSAFRKLEVNDRTQAVVVALKQGLLRL